MKSSKSSVRKPAPKKAAPKARPAKKSATKKSATKKPAPRKPATRKSAAGKSAPPARKAAPAKKAPAAVPAAKSAPFGEVALTSHFVELYRRAATSMPPDVIAAIERARDTEEPGSVARGTFETILENSRMAAADSRPVCQDTGMPFFDVAAPAGVSTGAIQRAAERATRLATEKGFLRPNSVDTLTNKNPGDGTGRGMPIVKVHEHGSKSLDVRLILKGGGCENVGAQFTLPNSEIGADRDLEGVKKMVLKAIHDAQGKGCAPGVLGVCYGGDRASGYEEAKRQLFRRLDDAHPLAELAAAEKELLEKGNQLGIGPMGYGGKTTLLGVKLSWLARLPASYFVSISYMCWATRRASLSVSPNGKAVYSQ